jgi:hypothetical protein
VTSVSPVQIPIRRCKSSAASSRFARFEIWVVIEGKQQAQGMVYKLDDTADSGA